MSKLYRVKIDMVTEGADTLEEANREVQAMLEGFQEIQANDFTIRRLTKREEKEHGFGLGKAVKV